MNLRSLIALTVVVFSSLVTPSFGAEVQSFTKNYISYGEHKENVAPETDPALFRKKVGNATFSRHPQVKEAVNNNRAVLSQEYDTIVFFITAPHDQENRGDTDYVQSVIRSLEKSSERSFEIKYIRGGNKNHYNQILYDIEELYKTVPTKNGLQEYQDPNSQLRDAAVSNIIAYIKNFPQKNKIIHLQLRAPETGCMIHLGDIPKLKELGKLIITCHEWSFYSGSVKLKLEQVKQLAYLKEADHVIFLNEADQREAVKAALDETLEKPKDLAPHSSVSNISSTVPTTVIFDLESLTKKPPNILIFGLIRPGKGFEEGIQLAEEIKKLSKDNELQAARVIIAGKPHDYKMLRSLVIAKYGKENVYIKNMNKAIETASQEPYKKIVKPFADITQKINNKNPAQQTTQKTSERIKDDIKIAALIKFLQNNADDNSEILPIDFCFNVDNNELDDLSRSCKFCVKLEGKCFANNSSSIINALHRCMVIFTRDGDITSHDFQEKGRFSNAVNLSKKSGDEINFIINKMSEIQKDSKLLEPIFKDMETCTLELFCDKKIADDHLKIYRQSF